MFSGNADLRSVPFDVAPAWVCSSCSCSPCVVAPVFHLFHELATKCGPKHIWGHFFSCESHCKVNFSSLQL